MKIRGAGERSQRRHSQKSVRISAKLGLALAGLSVLAIYSIVLIVMGMVLFRSVQPRGPEMAARAAVSEIPAKLLESGMNHLESMRNPVALERLKLDIAFKELEKLRAKRAEALRLGNLIASDGDFVKATIRHEGRSIRTKLRLKGDLLDHLDGDKWSFRVHTVKGDQLFGMRRFSLQSPAVRDFQGEPIFLAHLRREGVLAPRYRFVDLAVNGKEIGIMAIEEHFSKELLESQQRREGVILRFDESPFWMNKNLNGTFGPFSNPFVAMVKPFRSSKISKSPNLQSDLDSAIGLMRGFMSGDLAAGAVFDLDLMARFIAIVEVWNAHHSLGWHNMRFYYNPLTARLEPIGFDGHLNARPQRPGLVAESGHFVPLLLEHEDFRAVFIRELSRIAGEFADGDLADWAREKEARLIPMLQEGLEYIDPLPLDYLVARARKLVRIDEESFAHYMPPLGYPEMRYPEPIKVYVCNACTPARLEFVNALPVPVIVESISITPKKKRSDKSSGSIEGLTMPIEVAATEYMSRPEPVSVALGAPVDLAEFEVEAIVQVSGQGDRHAVRAIRYVHPSAMSPVPETTLGAALADHDFLRWDRKAKTLSVVPGTHDVKGSLVLPAGLPLRLAAGTELRFGENEILLATGPLTFEGTAERPIVLRPKPGSASWGGLAGIRSDGPHSWKHVLVESTTGIARPGWRLTGGVTLRGADVRIADSIFRGHLGEDALNLVRTKFELDNVEFHDTASDALDADYSDGVIRNGRLSGIGGDGIDVSGAKIEVVGTRLSDVADKAISAGEASHVTVANIRAERVGTGAASKDRSELLLEDSFIGGAVTAGVTVYVKKPEYGPASAVVNRVEMQNVATKVLVQIGSRATLDGEVVDEVPLETETLY
jgi:hypothetical protein